jgi:hypothetical protein
MQPVEGGPPSTLDRRLVRARGPSCGILTRPVELLFTWVWSAGMGNKERV